MAGGWTIIQAISVAVVLLISAQVEGQQGTSPSSVAAGIGERNIVINCSVQSTSGNDHLAWQYTPSWNNHAPVPIYTSFDNSVKDPANFSAVTYTFSSQGVQYRAADLTILIANPGLAAQYTCSRNPELTPFWTSSFLVLDPLQCPAPDETEYLAGTMVNITCSVHLYNKDPTTNQPTIELYRMDQAVLLPLGTVTHNDTTVTMTYHLTLAVEDDSVEYMCIVSFANNVPDYNDNCTMMYLVLHEVSEIIFDPPSSSNNPTTVAVGDQINCTANGRPAPTIFWYDMQGNIIDEGEWLTVTADMQSMPQPVTVLCVANNSIDGGATSVSFEANYTFLVGDASGEPQVQGAGVEAWVIAVAVVVPVVFLIVIAIIIFFVIRHSKKKKTNMKKKTTHNGSSTGNGTTANASTAYSPVATQEPSYASPSRPPPSSVPRTTNGAARAGNSPGFGDLGVQTYGGSNQAVNAYPTRNSAHGSNQALGGVSMNPNPGYPRVSNPALNLSSSSSTTRPNYPYQGSNSNINNTSLSGNQNPMMMPGVQNAGYGRQPSIASSSGRSHASNYNSGIVPGQAGDVNRLQNDLSSMHGSEV